MIKFVDEEGNIFEGQSPYIHWLKGGQSIGIWYNLNLLIITDNVDENIPLECRGLNEDGVFWFVRPDSLSDSIIDISEDSSALVYEYVDFSNNIISVKDKQYRLFQIHILCKSDKIGQITDDFNLTLGDDSVDVKIGGDFYTLDEILQINLSNKGLELPPYVEKALYDTNIHEANIDNIYINQKFKELISNYIDIVDCKGSYKSLINSLEWFDWGDNIKIYEIWKAGNETYFEKDIELILSDAFKHLLYTQSKTTYISLVTALSQPTNNFDSEKNPILEDIIRKWSNEDLAIKISVLGAFFERYFLPIYMDLKRACVEAHIYTVQNKIEIGEIIHNDSYITDSDPISIEMPTTVVIGNIDNAVAVGDNTMFGRVFDPDHYEDFVDDVEFDTLYTFDFEGKSIEYWKEYLEYTDDSVKEFVDKYESWAVKWTKQSDTIKYNGKVYNYWKPNKGDIIYGIMEDGELSSNYSYLKSKSIIENLDNRYAPFSNFLINVSGSEDYSSRQEWITGKSQSLVVVIKVEESDTRYNIHTHYTPVGVDYVENIISNETPNTNINKVTTIYLDDFPDNEGYSDYDNIRLWCWAIENSNDKKKPSDFDPDNDELPSDKKCKEILDSWAQFDGTFNEASHKYEYTGEDIIYDGNTYQLWRDSNYGEVDSYSDLPLYGLLPVNLQYSVDVMEENSLCNNLNNRYCPFVAFLNPDRQFKYDSNVSSGYRLLIEIDYESEFEDISGDIKQSTTYGQLIGGVGVVVPVKVSVNIPEGDGLCVEVINLYKNGIDNPPIQVIERKLFMSNTGIVNFNFNLVSTKLEEVSFSLTLHSLSGHTWTATAGYKVVDVSGCQLDVYKIENVDHSDRPGKDMADYLELMNGNPWGGQYNTIQTIPYTPQDGWIEPDKYTPQIITQYIPIISNDLTQYNEYIIVNNPLSSGEYKTDWTDEIPAEDFWALKWGEDDKYTLLVAKKPGRFSEDSVDNVIDYILSSYDNLYQGVSRSSLKKELINRHDYIFIPQLHKYTNLEDNIVDLTRNKKTMEYDFGGYNLTAKDLLCVRPKLTFSAPVDLGTIRWEFKNMTTLQTIQYDIPISKPMVANNQFKFLDPGFWSITMYFKLDGDGVEHKITKNSAFRIV